jgi:hypothetical protein
MYSVILAAIIEAQNSQPKRPPQTPPPPQFGAPTGIGMGSSNSLIPQTQSLPQSGGYGAYGYNPTAPQRPTIEELFVQHSKVKMAAEPTDKMEQSPTRSGKDGIIRIPGTEVMTKLGIVKHKSGSESYTSEYVELSRGCIGLNSLRRGQQGYVKDSTRAFKTLHEAEKAQIEMLSDKGNKSDEIVMIWAFQVTVDQREIERCVIDGKIGELRVERSDAGTEPIVGELTSKMPKNSVYDYATLFQDKDGTKRFWEHMEYGITNNPDLNVVHRSELPNRQTIYMVSRVKNHPLAPTTRK